MSRLEREIYEAELTGRAAFDGAPAGPESEPAGAGSVAGHEGPARGADPLERRIPARSDRDGVLPVGETAGGRPDAGTGRRRPTTCRWMTCISIRTASRGMRRTASG